jgi:hypothetical protein
VVYTFSRLGLVKLCIPPAEGFSSAKISGLVMGWSTENVLSLSVFGARAVALLISSTSIGRTYFPSLRV